MLDRAEKLRTARESRHPRVSQTEAGELLGMPRSTYASYERGVVEPTDAMFSILAKAWSIPLDWFYAETKALPPQHSGELKQVYISQERKDSIPFWGSCPAGEFEMPTDELEWVSVPREFADPDRFVAFRVAGDSMLPTLLPGDVIIVKRTAKPLPGRPVLAFWEGGLCLKRLKHRNGALALVSDNPDYPAIEPRDGIEYLGEVVSIRRDTL